MKENPNFKIKIEWWNKLPQNRKLDYAADWSGSLSPHSIYKGWEFSQITHNETVVKLIYDFINE